MRIDDFIGNISKIGIARNHRWTIMFGRHDINSRRLSTMCQSVTLPSKGFEFAETRTYGPGRNIATGQTYGDELKMEFLCGIDMYERKIFSAWMDDMVDPVTNNPRYYSGYICDMTVKMYDMKNNLRYAVKFYEMYPTALETYDLTQSGDDPWITAQVSFNYRKFVELQTPVAVKTGEESNLDDAVKSNQPTEEPSRNTTNPSIENPRGFNYNVNGHPVSEEEFNRFNNEEGGISDEEFRDWP